MKIEDFQDTKNLRFLRAMIGEKNSGGISLVKNHLLVTNIVIMPPHALIGGF